MLLFLLACTQDPCRGPLQVLHPDRDGDGFGDRSTQEMTCDAPIWMVADASDCDDRNSGVNPSALEMCDGIDNNCDGVLDDKDPSAVGQYAWHPDADNDGFGDAGVSVWACVAPPDLLADGSDCADDDENIRPNAVEICDDIDNDCDGLWDDEDAGVLGQPVWYADSDGDGFGDEAAYTMACVAPEGRVAEAGDCSDTDPSIFPSAQERNDGIDNDCDGTIDTYIGNVLITNEDGGSIFCRHYNTIYGDLTIQSWQSVDMQTLSCLREVVGDVEIKNNDGLESLTGLEGLSHVGLSLSIDNNDALVNLSGLSGLAQVAQDISIENNKVLQGLNGLENLSTLWGTLTINNNAALRHLNGLNNLDNTWGLIINNNASLRDISALRSLSYVLGDIRISHNPLLPFAHAANVIYSIPLIPPDVIILRE